MECMWSGKFKVEVRPVQETSLADITEESMPPFSVRTIGIDGVRILFLLCGCRSEGPSAALSSKII